MFSGIIEGQGQVVSINTDNTDESSVTLLIDITAFSETIAKDDNIAVNGVCLTVKSVENTFISFRLWPATLEKTNLGQLKPGMDVNLERNRY